MRIKNISGTVQLFSLGRRCVTLQPSEEVVMPDNEITVVDAVMREVNLGRLQLTEAPKLNSSLYSQIPKPTFVLKPGAHTRWAEGDAVTIKGVVFQTTATATRTIAGAILVDISAASSSATIAAAFAAALSSAPATAALAAVGIQFLGSKLVNSVYNLAFSLDISVTSLAAMSCTISATGSTGTAPSYLKPSATASVAPSWFSTAVTVPAATTSVFVVIPYSTVLATPGVTVRDADGVVQAAPTVNYTDTSVEVSGLTAGHIVTIVALVR